MTVPALLEALPPVDALGGGRRLCCELAPTVNSKRYIFLLLHRFGSAAPGIHNLFRCFFIEVGQVAERRGVGSFLARPRKGTSAGQVLSVQLFAAWAVGS